METMYLVAGLAVAGLVGIAAAFYFSIRSGSRRDKRLRSAGAGRAGTARRPESTSGARPGLAGHPRSTANGGGPATTFRPAAVSSRHSRAEEPVAATRLGDREAPPEDPWPGDAEAADSWSDDSWPDGTSRTARPRRRVGFRKGADLDEELWPTETFGGVSDEQFWDDMASDKPLATTARTAQQDSPSKARPPRTGPDPAAERTAIQPAYAATQPVQSMKSQPPGATQPVQSMKSQPPGATQPVRVAASSSPPRETAPAPRDPAPAPRRAATQPTETRRRRPSSAEEDPLTSAAFSLRPSGPVDGRSSLRARNTSADRHDNSSPYPYSAPTYGDSSSVTQAVATPPYGQDYGYGRRDSAQAGETRRHGRTGSHARPDGPGEGTRTGRQPNPRHGYPGNGGSQGSGGYPGNGSYPGTGYSGNGNRTGSYQAGGYPGNGYGGNGHRAPYDPRDDYRRLSARRPA
jgi:hypothetical protein